MAPSESGVVSIVVVNYNYGRFLDEAIESALAQTHDRVEVVVVDDGSTDESRALIDCYGDRVVAVLKENGGQASALNAGFEDVSGDVVIFLDADDVLEAQTAARAATAFAAQPRLAKVHYRLEIVNADGRATGASTPPAAIPLPSGDLRELLRHHPDDVPYPPSSGNAYAAWALERVLPMPEADYRVLADVYLLNLVPLLGPVGAFDGIGGRYRAHDANRHYSSRLRLDRVRATVRTIHVTHAHMRKLGDSIGLIGLPEPDRDNRSLVFLSQRLVSCKLEPGRHPLPSDTTWRLARCGVAAALGRSDLALGFRVLYAAWFLAMAIAPRRASTRLAEQLLFPESRGVASTLVDRLRRRS